MLVSNANPLRTFVFDEPIVRLMHEPLFNNLKMREDQLLTFDKLVKILESVSANLLTFLARENQGANRSLAGNV